MIASSYENFFRVQAEDGIRDMKRSRGLGDVYKRQTCQPATVPREEREFPLVSTCSHSVVRNDMPACYGPEGRKRIPSCRFGRLGVGKRCSADAVYFIQQQLSAERATLTLGKEAARPITSRFMKWTQVLMD